MDRTKLLVIITVGGFIGVLVAIAQTPLWMPGATLTGAIMVALGTEMALLIRALRENLKALGHEAPLNLWF